MLPMLASETTVSIDEIIFGTNKGVDGLMNVDRNGTDRVGLSVLNKDGSDGEEIDETMSVVDDSELGA